MPFEVSSTALADRQERELFRLPGGITFFLIVNLVLLWIVIFGFSRVVVWAPSARWFSFALAAAGIFALSIHTIFLLLGHNEFRAPSLEALVLGSDEPVLDPGYRFAMTFGAALMVGWTVLVFQMALLVGLALAFHVATAQ